MLDLQTQPASEPTKDSAPPGPGPTDPAQEAAALDQDARGVSPLRLALRSFRGHRSAMLGLAILAILYITAIFAEFIAPYGRDNQVRDLQWTGPTRLRMSDERGFSWRPFIYPIHGYIDPNTFEVKQEPDKSQRSYMRFFAPGDGYKLFGLIPARTHLFGFDEIKPAVEGDQYYTRFYLFGSDLSGRDIFSRICYGSRISMTIGLIGAAIVFVIGMLIGGISGYFGGIVDDLLQR